MRIEIKKKRVKHFNKLYIIIIVIIKKKKTTTIILWIVGANILEILWRNMRSTKLLNIMIYKIKIMNNLSQNF